MVIKKLAGAVMLVASMGVASATMAEDAQTNDPLEGFNRAMFAFNDTVDTYALKPIAKGYRFVTPDIIEKGVSNFFDNLGEVSNVVNNSLQGKFSDAGNDALRFAINSTVGVLGLVDVASEFDLPEHDEDFGQTLGVWGVESGPYIVLPLLGPTTARDGAGLVADYFTDPVNYIDDNGDRNAVTLVRLVDTRSRLLVSESLISGDKYTFIRDAYLQRRDFAVSDGEVDSYDDSNF